MLNNESLVRLLYFKKGTKVYVKLGWNKPHYCYNQGTGKKIRKNMDADNNLYQLIVSPDIIDDFLHANEIDYKSVRIEPESIDRFYQFEEGLTYTNLTQKFVDAWYDLDCPTLYIVQPNKDNHPNCFKDIIPHKKTVLVETKWSSIHINSEITEKEAIALTKNRSHSRIAGAVYSVLDAQELKLSGKLEKMKSYVEGFEGLVQEVILENKDWIINELVGRFKDKTFVNTQKQVRINQSLFDLDCGIVEIHTRDKDFSNYKATLSYIDTDSKEMKVRMPYFSQSTTINKEQFEIIRLLVLKELNIELYSVIIKD